MALFLAVDSVDNLLRDWMHNLCESVGWILCEVENDVNSVGGFKNSRSRDVIVITVGQCI